MRGKMWGLRAFVDCGYILGSGYFPFVLCTLPHSFSISLPALCPEELVLGSHHQASLVGFCQWRHWLEIRRRERLGNSFLACCCGFEMISYMAVQPLPWFYWNTSKLFPPCFSRLRGDNSFPTCQYLGTSKQLFYS